MTSYKKKKTKNSQGFKPASNINKNRNQEKGKKGIMQVSINLSVKEYDIQRNQNEERSNY